MEQLWWNMVDRTIVVKYGKLNDCYGGWNDLLYLLLWYTTGKKEGTLILNIDIIGQGKTSLPSSSYISYYSLNIINHLEPILF